MRTAVKNILGITGSWIPLVFVRYVTKFRDILPFYHVVSDGDMPHVKHFYRVKSVEQFIRDLDYLLSKYEPVSMTDWYEYSTGRKMLAKPVMVLSFDDGLKEIHDIIVPVLAEKGIPATFFINPSFIDNKRLFYKYKASLIIDRLEKHKYPASLLEVISSRLDISLRNKDSLKQALLNVKYNDEEFLEIVAELVEVDFETFLKIRQPYCSLKQLLNIRGQGFEFGSHSMDHPLFSSLSYEEQLLQVKDSIQWIRENLEQDNRFFSFPFTDEGVHSHFFDRLYSDEDPLVDMSFGTAGIKRDPCPFHFQRIPMDVTRTGARIFIKGEYLYCLFKSLVGRNVIRRKS